MWEQQSSIRIWAGTRLHPDLGAARLGQDLPGPARILMLDCLFLALLHTGGWQRGLERTTMRGTDRPDWKP